jgi:CO/xanthine dehydrogenase FAD-binding subunit
MRKPFQYLRPTTLREALEMKAQHGLKAKCWAGGTDLVLMWRRNEANPEYCLDLTFLPELRYIEPGKNEVRIGAMATLDDLDRASGLNSLMAVLGATARLMNTPQTRTLATVGGNLCNASPAADLSPPFVALDSEAKVLSASGERTVAMEEFFLGVNKTALKDDEILVEIKVPVPSLRREVTYQRVARTVVDIALVCSSVSLTMGEDGALTDARIVLGSVAPAPIRCKEAEKVLIGANAAKLDGGLVERAGQLAAKESKPISDVRASKEYRREMCSVLTRRVIDESVRKLGEA